MTTRRIALLGLGVAAALGLVGGARMLWRGALGGPGGEPQPSPCVDKATIQVTANPPAILWRQSSVISWTVALPSGCPFVQVQLNGEPVERTGSKEVFPPRSRPYAVTVSGGSTTKQATVRVEVTYPARVVIGPDTKDPVPVLVGALVDSQNEAQTVELCDVDLDLTGYSFVGTALDNRSLIASPGCERSPRRRGPRIFVNDKRDRSHPLFAFGGDHFLMSGFRLRGPTVVIGSGEDNDEVAVLIAPTEREGETLGLVQSMEVSNMEIYWWSGVGIKVQDNSATASLGRLVNTNVGAVHIKGNYIHHNQHDNDDGYGVDVTNGGYALIEQNVFETNRHAIAGGSHNGAKTDFSGYTARDNLILAGGGSHCVWWVICWRTHQIDMHGDESHPFNPDCCGIAGETIIIERNTILYTDGLAIKIRGSPLDKAVVDGNVFKHESSGAAITQNDADRKPIDIRPNNVFGVDPSQGLPRCDFVGDRTSADEFMATGVTWWARSGITHQWRFLNSMPGRLSDLKLGDVDGDKACDVVPLASFPGARGARYSKSGTSGWIPLGFREL